MLKKILGEIEIHIFFLYYFQKPLHILFLTPDILLKIIIILILITILSYLTKHFLGDKIDLKALKDKYNVAIIPKQMDDNINVQFQKSMPSDWTVDMSETERYYGDLMLGYNNMYALEVIGGPNKYYKYSEKQIHELFNKVKTLFTPDKFKIIVIPSYRTPENILKIAFNTFNVDHYVVKTIDKKAYLSALAISNYIVVTCDSTSMISEAAITGKPVYIAMMKSLKPTGRFKKFYSQLRDLGITRELGNSVENWSYNKLSEVTRIAPIIKTKMKKNGII